MVTVRIIDRAIDKTLTEYDNPQIWLPRIDEHILLDGLQYQVGSVFHDVKNNIVDIKVWKEGTVR